MEIIVEDYDQNHLLKKRSTIRKLKVANEANNLRNPSEDYATKSKPHIVQKEFTSVVLYHICINSSK